MFLQCDCKGNRRFSVFSLLNYSSRSSQEKLQWSVLVGWDPLAGDAKLIPPLSKGKGATGCCSGSSGWL